MNEKFAARPFPKQHPLTVLFLMFVTAGIYSAVWFLRRRADLTRCSGGAAFPLGAVILSLVLFSAAVPFMLTSAGAGAVSSVGMRKAAAVEVDVDGHPTTENDAALAVAGAGVAIVSGVVADVATLFERVLSFVAWLVLLLPAFRTRGALARYVNSVSSAKAPSWLWTVVLGPIYLQHRMNALAALGTAQTSSHP